MRLELFPLTCFIPMCQRIARNKNHDVCGNSPPQLLCGYFLLTIYRNDFVPLLPFIHANSLNTIDTVLNIPVLVNRPKLKLFAPSETTTFNTDLQGRELHYVLAFSKAHHCLNRICHKKRKKIRYKRYFLYT